MTWKIKEEKFLKNLQIVQSSCVTLARGELPPQLSLVSPKVFCPFGHRWSFGSLPLSPLVCLVGDTSFPAISSRCLN